jgi:hypothetical protein
VIFLADENVDRQIVEGLRLDSHEVAYIAEMSPGIMDETVLAESRNSASILITPLTKISANSSSATARYRLAFC